MRVPETKPVVTQTMGKKKHKLRKQSKDEKLCAAGSDSSDEAPPQGAAAGQGCTHLNKSIHFAAVKKSIKQQAALGECTSCTRDASGTKNEVGRSISPPPTAALAQQQGAAPLAEEETLEAAELTIWVCLQCGHQGCDRNSKDQHALKHYQTPRSSSHAVCININSWVVWCYDCDDEVFTDSSKKLTECVDFLRKQSGVTTGVSGGGGGVSRIEAATGRSASRAEQHPADAAAAVAAAAPPGRDGEKPRLQQQKSVNKLTPGMVLPKVKGLSNLGNTCFFNAVMQNLSQTPGLEAVISERNKKHLMVSIPATTVMDSDAEQTDSEEEDEPPAPEETQPVPETQQPGERGEEPAATDAEKNGELTSKKFHLSSLDIALPEGGALTQSLLSFLSDMNSTTKNSVISPTSLFGHVCRKAPRFKGFQQQDSHELLRHLLDGMKAEEVKRCQKGILKSFGLPENPNPKKVDELTKRKIKEYGRLVKHTFVDSVFGGLFISTVLCEECKHPSQIFEPFLDISLPITEEKPLRPNSIWSNRKKSEPSKATSGGATAAAVPAGQTATDGFAATAATTSDKPTKYMSKKAKKAARKEAKRKAKRGKSVSDEEAAGPTAPEGGDKPAEAGTAAPDAEGGKDGSAGGADSHSNEDWDSKSDADIEDNIESDVVRSRYHCLRDNAAQTDAASSATPTTPHTISDSKTTLINGVAFGANDIAGCGDVISETANQRTSKSDSELCTQTTTSGAKKSDSSLDLDSLTTSISSMGISNDTTATLKSASNEDDVTGAYSNSNVNGYIDDVITEPQTQNEAAASAAAATTTKSIANQTTPSAYQETSDHAPTAAILPKPVVKSKWEVRHELCVKATSTLVPRYQPVGHECSVLSCINQFTAMELLTGNNKFGCEKCTLRKHGRQQGKDGKKEAVYTNASKQVLVFSPPPVLTLHLKRFQQLLLFLQVGFSLRKVNRHVDFPLLLDLAPFCSSMAQGVRRGQTQVLYSLYGVVEHSGRLNNGHYTAYVKVRPRSENILQFINNRVTNGIKLHKLLELIARARDAEEGGKGTAAEGGEVEGETEGGDEERVDPSAGGGGGGAGAGTPPAGRWFYISDSRVNEVSEGAVLKSQAYILFYERVL